MNDDLNSIMLVKSDSQQLDERSMANEGQPRRNLRAQRTKSIFPQKLWQIVNNERLDAAIRWAHDGRSFMVYESQFKNLCLGKENKFFYTKQPKSFVRQLHLYGFRKINKNQFSHPNFKRNHPELLASIRRTYKQSSCLSSNEKLAHNGLNERDCHKTGETIDSFKHAHHQYSLRMDTVHKHNQQDKLQSDCRSGQGLELFNNAGIINSNQFNCQTATALPATIGALVFANNYDDSSAPPLAWYETNYVDANYSYNDDNILTLYNNDIYPNNICEDHNITL